MAKTKIKSLDFKDIRIYEKQANKWSYKLRNFNMHLEQNEILGIISYNANLQEDIFKLVTNKWKSLKSYQGLASVKFDYEKNLSIKNKQYIKNLAYSFDTKIIDNDSDDSKASQISLYQYLENYFVESNLLKTSLDDFSSAWKETFDNYGFYLKKEFALNFNNLEKTLKYMLEDLLEMLETFKVESARTSLSAINKNLEELEEKFTLIINKYKDIEYELMQISYNTINRFQKGEILLNYNQYVACRDKYIDAHNKYYNFFNLRKEIKKFKAQRRKEIRNEFFIQSNDVTLLLKKIYYDIKIENKFCMYKLSKAQSNKEYAYYLENYLIDNKISNLIKILLKNAKWLNMEIISIILQKIYELKTEIFDEFSFINLNKSKRNIRKNIALLVNNSFVIKEDFYKDIIDEKKANYIEKISQYSSKKKISTDEFEINFKNRFSLEELNQIKNEYIKIKNEYLWNYNNLYNDSTSVYSREMAQISKVKKANKNIFKKISSLFIHYLYSINSVVIDNYNSFDYKLITDYHVNMMKINNLWKTLESQRNDFQGYRKIFVNGLYHDCPIIRKFIIRSLVYTIMKKSNISLEKYNFSLDSFSNETKLKVEIEKIKINKPSLIVIGHYISKLSELMQKKFLNEINKYIFENNIIGIYLLNDFQVAKDVTTNIIFINNKKPIEQGKTLKIISNPINPLVKGFVGNADERTVENITDYISYLDDYENINRYEIDTDHKVWCTWEELNKWATKENVANPKLAALIFNEVEHSESVEVNFDNPNANEKDTELFDFSNTILNKEGKGEEMKPQFDHKIVEEKRVDKWNEAKFFSTHDLNKKAFTVILPPPNVTGKLHIGHAFGDYIQDTVIRYKKLQGFDVLWIPGKDHAGIATQAKIEKRLAEKKIDKYKIGRDKFLEEAIKWKDEYSKNITNQWNKLGLALDYDVERFTLDNDANEAVIKVFIDLYNDGLIYRDVKPINWDPILKTALSNIEVINKDVEQKMYYIKYMLKNSSSFIVVATTRLETMFSDVAIAINPSDIRAKNLLGKLVINPLTKKEIPIIASELIDKDFGTGLMKVSAHAMDDFNIIKDNKLELIECIDENGILNENAMQFKGLDRFEARKQIEAYLVKNNLIEKIEKITSAVGFSERSDCPIEILVQPQWFVKMKELAEGLLAHFNQEDKVNFIPKRFEDVLRKWMENVHDWTISRQIWWGHRIPAWYKDNKVLVQKNCPGDGWVQDEDVLDTWFSSALSPFVFLGWPQSTAKLDRYFPTSLLVTGYDIIFFWVARMYFQSLYFLDKKPFDTVLIHGLVRDSQGRKMSKSLGNGIDPIDVIDKYGSDVLRNALIFNSTPGQDINFGDDKINSAKLFINKFWNIARLISQIKIKDEIDYDLCKIDKFDLWILNKFIQLRKSIDDSMSKYEFTVIFKNIQNFIVNDLSSWYLEFLKLKSNKKFIHVLFRELLLTLHPFMPFLTDYLFETIYHEELLNNISYNFNVDFVQSDLQEIDSLINIITALRQYRESKKISKSELLKFNLEEFSLSTLYATIVNKMTNFEQEKNFDYLIEIPNAKIYVKLNKENIKNDINDLEAKIKQLQIDIDFNKKMLENPKFLEKASKKIIAEKTEKLNNFISQIEGYKEELTKKKNKLNEQ